MKIKKNVIKTILISIIMMLVFCQYNVFAAASVKASAGKTSLNIGETTSLSITANGCAGMFSVTSSNSAVVAVSSASTFVEGNSMDTPITLTAKGVGTATITISASDVTESELDADGNPVDFTGSTSVKITVTDPNANNNQTGNQQQPDPEPEQEPEPQKPTEPTFKQVNETVYVNQETVNVRGTWSASGGQYGTLKKGDSVTRTGVSSETINGYVWSRITYNGKTAYVISSALTTTKVEVPKDEEEKEEEEKSTNKLLKELIVEDYELTPEFNPQTTKYSLTLNETDEMLDITATPEDEKATVSITGNESFKVGNNIVKITVTAEDGTARIYTITVSKNNEDGVVDSLKLDSLQITNATLEPEFDPDITNYVITVEDPSTITAQSILATVSDKDITITTSETTPDENGEKIITLMLESQKEEKTGIYQITVKKPVVNQMAPTTLTNSSDNTIYYILGGIIGALIILIIIIIIALKKTSNKEDDEDIKNADELSDDYDYNLKGAIDEANKPYDDMVEESNFKSQILNTDLGDSDKTKVMNNFDNGYDDEEDFKPNVAPKKKGKHF